MIEGSGSVPQTNMDPDPDPEGPKKYASGSATLLENVKKYSELS
jgi:hypothetical protein